MVTVELLRQAHMAYLKRSGKQGRIYLPRQEHPHHPEDLRPRASKLGYCPIASALDRLHIPLTNPELDIEDDYRMQQLFQDGRDAEDVWSETLSWCELWTVSHQVEATGAVIGRCDTILEDSDGRWLVEYKKTDMRSPSVGHQSQFAVYLRNLNLSQGFLILQHRDYNDIWEVEAHDTGVVFRGTAGEFLLLWEELDRRIAAQDIAVAIATEPTLRPGECCKEKERDLLVYKKGQVEKSGTLTPKCPWYGRCWGNRTHFTSKAGVLTVEEP